MQLEDVTAEIRPRAPWESIDLGCVLAGKHIGQVWRAWFLTVVPLWILLAVIMRNHPVWFIIVVWWLKPLYARVPLLVLSRALFGALPSLWEVVKAWPKMLVRRLFFTLVTGRFSPARCLSMPVSELEGLRKGSYRQRVALLERNGGEGAVMATFVGLMLQLLVCFSLVAFVWVMMPAHVTSQWWQELSSWLEYSEFSEMSLGIFWSVAVVWMLGITVMEPFYVGAGFALYINSRTLTEGWDIELAFKRLGARLESLRKGERSEVASIPSAPSGKGAAMLLAVLVCAWSLAPDVQAAEDDAEPTAVQEVLADDDFIVHHKIIEVPVDDGSSSAPSWLANLFGNGGALPAFFGQMGVIFFYVILVVVIVGIAYLIYRNRHVFTGSMGGGNEAPQPKTTAVMGMDVRPESLPDDVASAARQAWRDGDTKLALSLLYRGSIAWLVHRAELPIEESDTEGDCVNHVNGLQDRSVVQYFSTLTDAWVNTAYGKQNPTDGRMIELCEGWPFQSASARAVRVNSEGRETPA